MQNWQPWICILTSSMGNGTIRSNTKQQKCNVYCFPGPKTRDEGNTSSSQSLAIEGSDQVLLSLIQVRKQQGVLPLKFFGLGHPGSIPIPLPFVTINVLRAR